MSEPETILLRATDGKNYPVRPLHMHCLEQLKTFIRQQALSAYYDWANSPSGLARTDEQERARAVACIAAQQYSYGEVFSAFNSVGGSLWLLHQFMEPVNKGLTEKAVERLFGPTIAETMGQWAVESGFTPPDPEEETTDGKDPMMSGKPNGTAPPP